LFERSS